MEIMRHRGYQWYETKDKVMVIDTVTGKPQSFGMPRKVIGSMGDALEYVKGGGSFGVGITDRLLIVRLDAVTVGLLAPVNESDGQTP